jgi:hypothetical protein
MCDRRKKMKIHTQRTIAEMKANLKSQSIPFPNSIV